MYAPNLTSYNNIKGNTNFNINNITTKDIFLLNNYYIEAKKNNINNMF